MSDADFSKPKNRTIIEANIEHSLEIHRFLNQDNPIHRHLDWLSPLDWLSQQPFLIERVYDHIQAIMLAAPEVKGVTWLRLFCVMDYLTIRGSWDYLLDKTLLMLKDLNITQLASLCYNDWYKDLLLSAKFYQQNTIVVLEWKGDLIGTAGIAPHFNIRPMRTDDLPEIEHIDRLAFSSLWQNTLKGLTLAYKQPGICTVASQDDQIIGYQISTTVMNQGHLARVAVHPDHQGKQVASALVLDLLKKFMMLGVWRVTVNTQSDNPSSLALYKKFGFKPTPDRIPVYLLQL